MWKRKRKQEAPVAIPAKVVGLKEFNFRPEEFPSMKKAKSRLAAIVKMLVPKKFKGEPKKFWVERNT